MTKAKKRLAIGLVISGIAAGFLTFLTLSFIPNSWNYAFVSRYGDEMDWHGRWLAGRHGIDCGHVKIGQDPKAASDCGLAAFAAGRAFRVRYDIQGFEDAVAGGIVRTSDGHLYALSFTWGDPGGGRSLLEQTVDVQSCPEPYRIFVNPKGRLNCFQPQLSYPASVTSPNSEPY